MPSSQGQVVAIAIIFMLLPGAFVGMRVWAKFLSQGRLTWDDYTIFGAMGMTIASCAVQLIAAFEGQLGQHQANTPEGMPILDDPRFLVYERCKFALNMLTYLGFGFSKASILLLYIRIFDVRSFRIWPRILLAIVIAWTVTFFFTSLFQCYPVTALIEPFYHNNCMPGIIYMWYTGAATDIFLDFSILAMPVPMVIKLRLPWKQKLGVICMFLTGALAAAASIARLVVYVQVGAVLKHHFNDQTYHTTPVFVWTVVELSLAVISACLPTLRPIYTYFQNGGGPTSLLQFRSSNPAKSSPTSSSSASYPLSSRSPPRSASSSVGLSGKGGKSGLGFANINIGGRLSGKRKAGENAAGREKSSHSIAGVGGVGGGDGGGGGGRSFHGGKRSRHNRYIRSSSQDDLNVPPFEPQTLALQGEPVRTRIQRGSGDSRDVPDREGVIAVRDTIERV